MDNKEKLSFNEISVSILLAFLFMLKADQAGLEKINSQRKAEEVAKIDPMLALMIKYPECIKFFLDYEKVKENPFLTEDLGEMLKKVEAERAELKARTLSKIQGIKINVSSWSIMTCSSVAEYVTGYEEVKETVSLEEFREILEELKPEIIKVIHKNFRNSDQNFTSPLSTDPFHKPLYSTYKVVKKFLSNLKRSFRLEINLKTEIIEPLINEENTKTGKNYCITDILPNVIDSDYVIYYAKEIFKEYRRLGLNAADFDIMVSPEAKKEIVESFVKSITEKTPEHRLIARLITELKILSETSLELILAQENQDLEALTPLLQDTQTLRKSFVEINSVMGSKYLTKILQFISQTKNIPQETADLIFLTLKIRDAESVEIQRLLDYLTESILESSDPRATCEEIMNVFTQNHLPLVAKHFLLFNTLYPKSVLSSKITESTSLVLRSLSDSSRRFVIWTDLLKSYVLSGNWDLISYLQQIQSCEGVLEKMEQGQILTSVEEIKLKNLFKRLEVVYSQTILGKRSQRNQDLAKNSTTEAEEKEKNEQDLNLNWQKLKEAFGLKNGQKLIDRIVEIFAGPIGCNSLAEVLKLAKESKKSADERNRKNENLTNILESGTLIKAVSARDLESILASGLLTRVLTGSEDIYPDATPFDSDFLKIEKLSEIASCSDFPKISCYGNIILVVQEREQFIEHPNSNEFKKEKKTSSGKYFEKYESIHTPLHAQNHYGVRTALDSAQISKIVLTEKFEEKIESLEELEERKKFLFYQIAKGGFFIPVFNRQGNLIFGPQDFDKFRQIFAGLERFGGEKIEIQRAANPKLRQKMKQVLAEQAKSQEALQKIQDGIEVFLKNIFQEFGISEQSELDYSGFKLEKTGSTARGTHLPLTTNSIPDFDYTCYLGKSDLRKREQIIARICEQLQLKREQIISHDLGEGRWQLKLEGVLPQMIGLDGKNYPLLKIDLGFYPKNSLDSYFSHEAVEGKLASIEQTYGLEIRQEVSANILLLKKILQENGLYKKENGGLTGIAVENLVLRFGGNLESVFEAICSQAYQTGGNLISVEEFQQKMLLLDAGANIRNLAEREDFLGHLTDQSLQKLVTLAQNYLDKTRKKAAQN